MFTVDIVNARDRRKIDRAVSAFRANRYEPWQESPVQITLHERYERLSIWTANRQELDDARTALLAYLCRFRASGVLRSKGKTRKVGDGAVEWTVELNLAIDSETASQVVDVLGERVPGAKAEVFREGRVRIKAKDIDDMRLAIDTLHSSSAELLHRRGLDCRWDEVFDEETRLALYPAPEPYGAERERWYHYQKYLADHETWEIGRACYLIQDPQEIVYRFAIESDSSEGGKLLEEHIIMDWLYGQIALHAETEGNKGMKCIEAPGGQRVNSGDFLRLAMDEFPEWAPGTTLQLEHFIPKFLQDRATPPSSCAGRDSKTESHCGFFTAREVMERLQTKKQLTAEGARSRVYNHAKKGSLPTASPGADGRMRFERGAALAWIEDQTGPHSRGLDPYEVG